MIRYVVLLRRRPGSTRADFLHAWLGEHRRLARALPLVRKVVFTPTVGLDDSEPEFDGLGHLEFDSLPELQRSLATSEAIALRAHTATFADSAASIRAVVDTELEPVRPDPIAEPGDPESRVSRPHPAL